MILSLRPYTHKGTQEPLPEERRADGSREQIDTCTDREQPAIPVALAHDRNLHVAAECLDFADDVPESGPAYALPPADVVVRIGG